LARCIQVSFAELYTVKSMMACMKIWHGMSKVEAKPEVRPLTKPRSSTEWYLDKVKLNKY